MWWQAALLAAAFVVLTVVSLRLGPYAIVNDFASALHGASAAFGLMSPLADEMAQTIVELRLWRTLTAGGVGAALGLAGALVQGVFRNGLASPSVLGVSSGASLGAIGAMLAVSGYGARILPGQPGSGVLVIPACAFLGALLTTGLVYRLSVSAGRASIPALLLIGIATNTFLGGIQQLLQMLVLTDAQVTMSILKWSFGTLDDREAWHAAVAWSGVGIALAVAPFVAYELDLMQVGIEDAEALGVNTKRVKLLAITASSITTAAAVAVAGQIGFVGLVVPHIVRLLSGTSYRALLPLSALLGAVFLVAADLAQHALLPEDVALQPGVTMSLVGGPFFVYLLWKKRREIAVW